MNEFTARATIKPKSASATVACTTIVYFARRVSGITSVGLNAVAFVNPRCRQSRKTFFAGISVKLDSFGARAALLGLGCVLFLGTLIWALTLPVQLAT